MRTLEELLCEKIKILNETIWENNVTKASIDAWLDNFDKKNDREILHALYLLSKFMYFGTQEIRQLLIALYRDLYKYPIIQEIRKKNQDTTDLDFINLEFDKELKRTRFLGMGNPSESGCHMLYLFRQENELSSNLFINSHEIFSMANKKAKLRDRTIKKYIFIDDFCGSGEQARDYSDIAEKIKKLDKKAKVYYFTLFSTRSGIDKVETETSFDKVESVISLDDSFKCFEENNRYFGKKEGEYAKIELEFAKNMCMKYGAKLLGQEMALGYKKSQLLIGFHHNTPDNTIPIIWYDKKNWHPIFRRYQKIYCL